MTSKVFFAVVSFLSLSVLTAAAGTMPKDLVGLKAVKVWQFDKDTAGWLPDHNIADFRAENGLLKFRTAGVDPWILTKDVKGLDAGSRHFLAVKMRASEAGANQVYFSTDQFPDAAANAGSGAIYSVTGDNKFHVYEMDVSQWPAWKGKLTMLRIDPVNGGHEANTSVEIDWIALYQRPAQLVMTRPSVVDLWGRERVLGIAITFKNIGGEPTGPHVYLDYTGDEGHMNPLAPGQTRESTFSLDRSFAPFTLVAEQAGKQVLTATLMSPAVGSSDRRIGNETTSVEFTGNVPLIAARLYTRRSGKQALMGSLCPLATLVYRDSEGVFHYDEIGPDQVSIVDEHSAHLTAKRKVNGGTATFNWSFALPEGKAEGTMSCEMTCTKPVDILRFEGPRLLAGEGARNGREMKHALFPGLEYLEPGEQSSSPDYVGPKYADRRIPHPYKITVPVMAVEREEGIVGLSWNPLAEWADGQALPCAEFESPNRGRDSSNHLMTLFAPSIPEYVDENSELAKHPYTLQPGKHIRISASFFARPGTITDVIPNWMAAHGTPKAPPIPHGVDGTIDLCLKAYTESLYSPEKNGWKTHFGIGMAHYSDPSIASAILAESLRKPDAALASKCEIGPDSQLAQYLGTSLDWFSESALKQVDATIAEQSTDGGFPYRESEEIKKKTKETAALGGIDIDSLGKEGTTQPGYIAAKLTGVLSQALKTGSKTCAKAGIKGLARINSFTVPRGASTWEVPLDTPENLSAACCVNANVLGYQLTGNVEYLEKAKFWAYTGLPFIYMWVPPIDPLLRSVLVYKDKGEGTEAIWTNASELYDDPRRQVLPGASDSEFGTSFYVVSWFGQPVQWCGQEWACAVQRYLRLRPDATLRSAADMVFASIAQQQVEKGPLAGCFTDVWGVYWTGNSPVFIYPGLILDYALGLKDEKQPNRLESVGLNLAGGRSVLNTHALIQSCESRGSSVEAELKWYSGQDLYACIVPAAKPASVQVGGEGLTETSDLKAAPSGWYYDEANRALHVKNRPKERVVSLGVTW